jgi:hypothetical protein
MSTRIIAGIIFAVAIVSLGFGLVRMSVQARDHSRTLRSELDRIDVVPEAQRIRIEQFYKAGLASVSAEYRVNVSPQALMAHYARVLDARGWRNCGHNRSGDIYQLKTTTTHERYCRGQMRAILTRIDGQRPVGFTLELEWNRWTLGVWAMTVLLSWVVFGSAFVFVRGGPPFCGVMKHRPKSKLVFRTDLNRSECISRLRNTRETGLESQVNPVEGGITEFSLEKQRSIVGANAFAPYFRGTLRETSAVGGTAVEGYFSISPSALAGLVVAGVILCIAFATTFVLEAPPTIDSLLWGFAIVALIAVLVVWRWLAQSRTILTQMMRLLEADRP